MKLHHPESIPVRKATSLLLLATATLPVRAEEGRSVDRCVTTLRGKIASDSRHPEFIQTIRNVGYRF